MAVASDPIPVGASTPATFDFSERSAINVQIAFYSDIAATDASLIAAGSGTRDITASNSSVAFDIDDPQRVQTVHEGLVTALEDGVLLATPARTWRLLGLGEGLTQVFLSATGGGDPGGAVSYRFIVDMEPRP